MYYYLIIAFQAYCIYHAYKNKSDYYWIFIIFFIPLLGCLIYLFTQVLNKRDVANITEEINTIINPTKKIKDLEQQLKFSSTFQNRVNLADAYAENKDFKNAIFHYEKALKGSFKNDIHTINKLIKSYFFSSEFQKVIEYAEKINLDKDFESTLYFYALSLEKNKDFENAEIQFKKIDKRFSNYNERLELSRFFIRISKENDAKEILEEIISEINSMEKNNSRKYRHIVNEAREVLKFIPQ
jgi:hypothetical protein